MLARKTLFFILYKFNCFCKKLLEFVYKLNNQNFHIESFLGPVSHLEAGSADFSLSCVHHSQTGNVNEKAINFL